MKRYVPIIIGIVALCAVLYVVNVERTKDARANADKKSVLVYEGSVTRNFEGENTLTYSFNLPEGATTTVEKDGALVKVNNDQSQMVSAMYFSYEGGRGYTPDDYIDNVIAKSVKSIEDVGTTTIGGHEWSVVESEWSVWHVAKSENGQWLLVVENKKTENERANAIIESIVTK
jgi:hypothetical protein